MKKLVWYDIETGRFSDSWNVDDESTMDIDSALDYANNHKINDKPSWKLIQFECINDENFEFMHLMKTN